jgi:hypothetical protein
MSALFAGHTASFAALLLVLVVVPLVALAVRLTLDQARKSARGRDARRRDQAVMDERIRARLEATIWPD